jgi:hypothetical protein
MTEEFLHYIWKFRLFDQSELRTTCNKQVEIIKTGTHNFDSGPDFFNARIKIDETIWAGNVEVHINSADWKKHKHQFDKAYDNIILHVVNNANEKLFRSSGEEIPAIEIKDRIDRKLYDNYLNFKNAGQAIPCSPQLRIVPDLIINSTIDKLLLERLEKRSETVKRFLSLNNHNWEESFYQAMARSFGFKTNSEPFELLAKSLPSGILAKHKDSLFQLEAMLFGQAGMLDTHFNDKYPITLQNEFVFLKQKFRLQPVDRHLWKFLRLRPVNFPTVRIAQFANLIHNSSHLFSKILEADSIVGIRRLLNVSVSPYWETHYMFDKQTAMKKKDLGEEGLNSIIINTVVPFLFVYGKQRGEEKFADRALQFLEMLEAEQNSIVNSWRDAGLKVSNAHSSQALIQLKTEYCTAKKCLNCNIGTYLLKNS